jgi:uncharacterized protein
MPLILELKVVPSSGSYKWVLDKSGVIKCFLKAPAQEGKANRELIMLLARLLRVPQENIVIIKGLTSQRKMIKISAALSYDQFLGIIGLDTQLTL